MILVDSSIWIDHIRAPDELLTALLTRHEVLGHPFVIGEVAVGSIRNRDAVLASLQELPGAPIATDGDVLNLIEQHRLHGRGIGYVDAHLLAASRLTRGTSLWTRDRRLRDIATELGLAARLTH
ncbi:MAG TPA: PIN domain-containing protein [Stellaceae bacterium]|nr:PIN domain-containing protein [Stellaceae bacterium]